MIILIDKKTRLETRRIEPFQAFKLEPGETLGGNDNPIRKTSYNLTELLGIKFGFCSSCKRDNATFEST